MRRFIRRHALRLRWWLLALALVAVAIGGAVHWATGTPEGRVRVVTALLGEVSGMIRGSMSVATVSELELNGHVVAEHFVIRDERGDEVISAERASIELDVLALLDGEVRISSARAERGRVHVVERANGEIGLDVAFRNSAPPPPAPEGSEGGPAPEGGPDEGDGGFVVILSDIEAIQTVLFVRTHAGPRARIDGIGAHVAVRAAGGRPAVVRFWDASGQAHLVEPVALDAHLSNVEGRFDGASDDRFEAQVHGRLASERIEAEVLMHMIDGAAHLEVTTHSHGPLGALAGLGIDLIDG
jgi:hypothetical protein